MTSPIIIRFDKVGLQLGFKTGKKKTNLTGLWCGEVHEEYLREQSSSRWVETPLRESPRPPRRREVSPPPATQHRASRSDQPSNSGPKNPTSNPTGVTAIPGPPTSRLANRGNIEPPVSTPTTRAIPTTPSLTLVEYFTLISHLP